MKKNIMNFQSHEKQDQFVIKLQKYLLNKPDKQYYLDVASGHPIIGNNTYVLDTELSWFGFGFDLGDRAEMWNTTRKNGKYIQKDVCSMDFTQFLLDQKHYLYDYLSLDVDIGGYEPKNYSHIALDRILDADIKCKIITYEHESFKYGDLDKNSVRMKLDKRGYVILFKDVCFPDGTPWEDWIIHKDYFDDDILRFQQEKLTYNQIITLL
jgi:hypothetical protein